MDSDTVLMISDKCLVGALLLIPQVSKPRTYIVNECVCQYNKTKKKQYSTVEMRIQPHTVTKSHSLDVRVCNCVAVWLFMVYGYVAMARSIWICGCVAVNQNCK
jgi:hypothetical protein